MELNYTKMRRCYTIIAELVHANTSHVIKETNASEFSIVCGSITKMSSFSTFNLLHDS